jgi:hypothetical protein
LCPIEGADLARGRLKWESGAAEGHGPNKAMSQTPIPELPRSGNWERPASWHWLRPAMGHRLGSDAQ